jgi:hypothetical protein
MKDEETDQLQDELIRLQIENARLRATIDRLEHQRRLENPASAKTGARAEKIRRLLIGHFWDKRRQEGYSGIQMLMAIALSNMCYALAFVFTLAQAEAVSIMRSVPWTWTFVFVFVSPILFLLIVSFYAGRIERYTRRNAQQRPRNISRRQVPRD